MNEFSSWGMFPRSQNQRAIDLISRLEKLPVTNDLVLPRGLGRSYGDSCLNNGHSLLVSRWLKNFISFDPHSGDLICESGVTLSEIIDLCFPQGWFLPVTPGTKFVTLGGALANDVHGKNHHRAGSIGNFVKAFELIRSDGQRLECTPDHNADFFSATIGGLGLTGFVTWIHLQLKPVSSSKIDEEQERFFSLEEFFKLSDESKDAFEYTVAWVDLLRRKQALRGLFIRGNHASAAVERPTFVLSKSNLSIPFFFPESVLNPLSLKIFNQLYFYKNIKKLIRRQVSLDPFFYPLDAIGGWNRIYGRRGFLQYQFVIPHDSAGLLALSEILNLLQTSGYGTFLAVLKAFGTKPSVGMMSFARPGITLALDFPNYGRDLFKVLNTCDELVQQARGAVYLAKDSRMSKAAFAAFYPQAQRFRQFIDPQFSSSQWRRLT